MSTEENKAIARRFMEEVWNQRNMDVFDELISAEYVHHDEPCAGTQTAAEFKDWISGVQNLIPDLHTTVEDVLAEGDQVVVRGKTQGTHTREIWGIAPTGKPLKVRGINITRIADGKMAEGWITQDRMGLQLQIEGKV